MLAATMKQRGLRPHDLFLDADHLTEMGSAIVGERIAASLFPLLR